MGHLGQQDDGATRARARVLGLLSVGFLLDQATIGLGGLAATDTLLVLAINQANIAPLTRVAATRNAYGLLEAPAPDAERRPVSISAVANSLGLPFETTRRHVKRLEAAGVCVACARGVIVPAAFLRSDGYIETVLAGHARLRAFYEAARNAGLVDPLPASAFPAGEAEPIRAAARLRADYVLRSAEALTRFTGDIVNGLIYLGLVDMAGRPTANAALARRLGMPEETVRRRVAALAGRGVCVRLPQGVLVSEAMLDAEPALGFFAANAANVQRLFAALAERGVMEGWT